MGVCVRRANGFEEVGVVEADTDTVKFIGIGEWWLCVCRVMGSVWMLKVGGGLSNGFDAVLCDALCMLRVGDMVHLGVVLCLLSGEGRVGVWVWRKGVWGDCVANIVKMCGVDGVGVCVRGSDAEVGCVRWSWILRVWG